MMADRRCPECGSDQLEPIEAGFYCRGCGNITLTKQIELVRGKNASLSSSFLLYAGTVMAVDVQYQHYCDKRISAGQAPSTFEYWLNKVVCMGLAAEYAMVTELEQLQMGQELIEDAQINDETERNES